MGLKETEIKGNQEVAGKAGKIDAALTEIKQKVDVTKYVWDEMGNLYQNFNKLSLSETFERFKGIFVMGALGMLMGKEEFEEWRKERADITVKENPSKNYEIDKNPTPRQALTNMKSIQFYDPDTKQPLEKPTNRIGKKLRQKNIYPSAFILGKSSDLFRGGVGNFDDFKKNISTKLVHESIKDPKERERQACIILSYCAIGNFQIVPKAHFERLGWSTEGEKGLKDMYEFISSTDKQFDLYKAILGSLWNKYKDPGLVGVEYYTGSANGYKNNPKNPKFHKEQYGNHASIHTYAEKIRAFYAENRKNYPQLSEVECVAMAIEKIESGGGLVKSKILSGQRIS